MKVFMFLEEDGPEYKRTAELAIEFVTRTYKDELLADLEYVFLFPASPSTSRRKWSGRLGRRCRRALWRSRRSSTSPSPRS